MAAEEAAGADPRQVQRVRGPDPAVDEVAGHAEQRRRRRVEGAGRAHARDQRVLGRQPGVGPGQHRVDGDGGDRRAEPEIDQRPEPGSGQVREDGGAAQDPGGRGVERELHASTLIQRNCAPATAA